MNDGNEVIYRLDGDDVIVATGGGWDAFARAGGAPELLSPRVIGRRLWDFIHDAETRHLHKVLIERVRAGRPLGNLPFRCDAPALRRFMAMDIVPLADGLVEFRCRVIRTEERKPPAIWPEGAPPAGSAFIRMCSWCKQVESGDTWVEIETALASPAFQGAFALPPITHGMCDACFVRLYGEKG